MHVSKPIIIFLSSTPPPHKASAGRPAIHPFSDLQGILARANKPGLKCPHHMICLLFVVFMTEQALHVPLLVVHAVCVFGKTFRTVALDTVGDFL